jgi:hypothetical protein
MKQLDLLEWEPPLPNIHFKGETYNVALDLERLNAQRRRVHDALLNNGWMTLREIATATGDPEPSISARIRDFRNHEYLTQFFVSEGRRRGDAKRGLWEYSLRRRGP